MGVGLVRPQMEPVWTKWPEAPLSRLCRGPKEGPTGWALVAGNTAAQFLVAAAAS